LRPQSSCTTMPHADTPQHFPGTSNSYGVSLGREAAPIRCCRSSADRRPYTGMMPPISSTHTPPPVLATADLGNS
jgi:hypothetical protein